MVSHMCKQLTYIYIAQMSNFVADPHLLRRDFAPMGTSNELRGAPDKRYPLCVDISIFDHL